MARKATFDGYQVSVICQNRNHDDDGDDGADDEDDRDQLSNF